MHLKIISPEATLFNDEVESITVPGTEGSFQVLNNHAPIVSTLQAGTVKVPGSLKVDKTFRDKFTFEKDHTLLSINSGTFEMKENKVVLLID